MCKGKQGKIRKFQFDDEAMESIRKWLEVRGEDDCKYLFVTKNKMVKQIKCHLVHLTLGVITLEKY